MGILHFSVEALLPPAQLAELFLIKRFRDADRYYDGYPFLIGITSES
jgi:hypothetical protein